MAYCEQVGLNLHVDNIFFGHMLRYAWIATMRRAVLLASTRRPASLAKRTEVARRRRVEWRRCISPTGRIRAACGGALDDTIRVGDAGIGSAVWMWVFVRGTECAVQADFLVDGLPATSSVDHGLLPMPRGV